MSAARIKLFFSIFFIATLALPVRSFTPFGIFGSISIVDAALLIGAILLVTSAILSQKLDIGNKYIFVVISAPFFAALSSLLWTINHQITFKQIIVTGASIFAFLLSIWVFRKWSYDSLRRLLAIFGFTGVLVAAVSYIPGSPISPLQLHAHHFGSKDDFFLIYYARFSHPFWGLTTGFGTILGVLLILILLTPTGLGSSRGVLAACIIILAGVLATLARGPILALGILTAGWLFWSVVVRGRLPIVMMLAVLLSVPVFLTFFIISPDASGFLESRFSSGGVTARFEMYRTAVKIVIENMFLGVGGGVEFSSVSHFGSRTIHNAYLQNLMWYGVFIGGLISLLMVASPIVVASWKVHNYRAWRVRAALSMSLLFFVLVNLSESIWADGSLVVIVVYVVFGVGILMLRAANNQSAEAVDARN